MKQFKWLRAGTRIIRGTYHTNLILMKNAEQKEKRTGDDIRQVISSLYDQYFCDTPIVKIASSTSKETAMN